ncbi:hypothetical protein M407DRAFT_30336 [Tulasnella calospora MUT 4182]|uniref:DNA-directed DNA polymerase n=1 Tax=Tulasnella calospora MUT 4182 TaxID=1051891 RepID=A0A0C3KEY8_9AGAM|nr:hypothetical protein M407DRAFT_30336 [Tulasnella calospora MUT 4182]
MHPDEVRRGEDVKVDFEYYLSQQVLPPVERLCDPIEGTDRAHIAECLGLDASKFQSAPVAGSQERDFVSFASLVSDKDRFRDAESFLLEFQSKFRIQSSLHTQIRQCIARYYEGWTVCDEEICQNRTRSVAMHSRNCSRPECTGTVRVEYSDAQVYNQLLYFRSLFDGAKAIEHAHGSFSRGDVEAFVHVNQDFLSSTMRLVDGYLNQCGRGWVELNTLFASL